jgi:outer membrane immunogenic protein
MRLFLATILVAGLTGTAAFAADVTIEEPPAPIAEAPVFSWTGGYIGIQGGWSWGDDHTFESITATGTPTGFDQDFEPDGFVGGIHIGYNWQANQFVYGAEADFEFSTVDGGYTLLNGNGTSFEQDWQASIRARLGFVATDRLLVYATGGVAFTDLSYTYFTPLIAESFDSTETGWTVGGGAEYAFTDNLTARLEYRYTDFGEISNNSTAAFPGFTYSHDPQFHTVRVGFSYKF